MGDGMALGARLGPRCPPAPHPLGSPSHLGAG